MQKLQKMSIKYEVCLKDITTSVSTKFFFVFFQKKIRIAKERIEASIREAKI